MKVDVTRGNQSAEACLAQRLRRRALGVPVCTMPAGALNGHVRIINSS